jgi:hypothetical protein
MCVRIKKKEPNSTAEEGNKNMHHAYESRVTIRGFQVWVLDITEQQARRRTLRSRDSKEQTATYNEPTARAPDAPPAPSIMFSSFFFLFLFRFR